MSTQTADAVDTSFVDLAQDTQPSFSLASPDQSRAVAAAPAHQREVSLDHSAKLIDAIAAAARDPQVDIEKMERLWQMHQRMTDRAAEDHFNVRMTAAQSDMGPISTDAENSQTHSKYATYAKLDGVLRPIYTKHGFSLSFNSGEGAPEQHVRVLAYVSCGGHTRTYTADIPCDGKGAKGNDVMTKTHAAGAARSYGMRYLLKMIFNVAVGEFDNDGNGSGLTRQEWLDAWMLSIRNARNVGELRRVMADAIAEAKSENDQDAEDRFLVAQADKMARAQVPGKTKTTTSRAEARPASTAMDDFADEDIPH